MVKTCKRWNETISKILYKALAHFELEKMGIVINGEFLFHFDAVKRFLKSGTDFYS